MTVPEWVIVIVKAMHGICIGMDGDWNSALRFVSDLKGRYRDRFGEDTLYSYDEGNCLAHWVSSLGDPYHASILSELSVNECDGLVLMHYRIPHPIDGGDYYEAYDGLLAECRSVVIDVRNERLVLTPFRKFMNINESPSTSEDRIRDMLLHADVVEFSDKLDGSMQSARFYDGRLVMAGSKAVDRKVSVRLDRGYRFVESNRNYLDMIRDNPELTFVFEYIYEDDPHVVDYSDREQGLYLIGIRDVRDGREHHYHEVLAMARGYGVMTTVVDDLGLDEALEVLRSADGSSKEGYVLNIDGFRVKLKSDDYVFLNKAIWNICDDENIIRIIRDGVYDDVISKVPAVLRQEVRMKADKVFSYIGSIKAEVRGYLDAVRALDRRDAMIWISENVPQEFASYVRNEYLGLEVDYISKLRVSDVFGSR